MAARRFLTILFLTVLANIIVILRVSGWGMQHGPNSTKGSLSLSEGDLVLRCSKGLVGDWFRRTSLSDRRFSHAGIFIQTEDGPAVVHVSQDPPSGLKVESLERFCSSRNSSLVGWVRTDLSDEQRGLLHAVIGRELSNGRSFDMKFSLEEKQMHYCTEWVREVFSCATGDSMFFPVTEIDGFRYVAPDNLYLGARSNLIHTFEP